MDERTDKNAARDNASGKPFSLTLMSENGTMRTLWLPAQLRGHFTFGDSSKDATLPIYVEPQQDCWCLFCSEKNGYFSRGYEHLGRSAPLFHESLINFEIDGRKYAIYAEAVDGRIAAFHPYYVEDNADITIGRMAQCDICCSNTLVSRRHAMIRRRGTDWFIKDLGSSNGTFLNGRAIQSETAKIGDEIFIMGLKIIIGTTFISMNDGNGRIQITTPQLHEVMNRTQITYSAGRAQEKGPESFSRKPRSRMSMKAEPIRIEKPPMPLNANNIPLLLRLGTPAVLGGNALMNGNIMMALTSMVMPFLTQGYTEKDRKRYEERRTEKYTAYLSAKTEEIEQECSRETKALNFNYPQMREVANQVKRRNRVWERRTIDDDFLWIRLGTGNIPMLAELAYDKEKLDLEQDPLETKMYEIAQNPPLLTNAPVITSLTSDWICGISGDNESIIRMVRNICLQIAAFHSYEEVKIVLFASEQDMKSLDFIRYLPHFWDDEYTVRFFATKPEETGPISAYLENVFGEELDKNDSLEKVLEKRPYYVVINLSKPIFESVEILRQVQKTNRNIGLSIITGGSDLPKECRTIIELSDQGGSIRFVRELERPMTEFVFDNEDPKTTHDAFYSLSNLSLRNSRSEFQLPKMITFLEMFGVGKVEHLNPLKRWAENNPVKSLAAEVGIGTSGNIFTLNLHEKYQGPHGLVAGMTGSGKSEFIITYILSMAVNYHPNEVAFVLIDYKGGGLAGAFHDEERGIHLPHLVGTITNLDGAAISRSLMSIESELKRRQAVFNAAKSRNNEGTMDIYTYQKLYRAGKVSEPMPHLFVISDEFAELKQQEPEFMEKLISTARIGRSLGVHLILATQKPAGVVNDQILSNTKFRVCLKVQDKNDSMDMLKRPEAAELRETGRFYLQVGYNEMFALGQSAWAGADYIPQNEIVESSDDSIQVVDSVGRVILNEKPKVVKNKSDVKQIVAIVKYLSELAKKENVQTRPLWCEPLPDHLDIDKLNAQYKSHSAIGTYIGMIDDPAHQTQFPLYLDLQNCRNLYLIGESGSGKSVFLNALLYRLASQYSPEDLVFYTVDFSGRKLNIFSELPHCGASLDDSDESAFERLLKFVADSVKTRKKLFEQAKVDSLEAYREKHSMPLMLIVIDNFTGISAFEKGNRFFSEFHEYMRDAASFGIKFIITSSHLNEVSTKTKQELGTRITLRMKDKFEYSDALSLRCTFMPDDRCGRGLCVSDGQLLEYQCAMVRPELSESDRAAYLAEYLGKLALRDADKSRAYRIPRVDHEEMYSHFIADIPTHRLPIGYRLETGGKVSVPYKQLFCLSLYFGNESGRKPILENLLSAVKRDGGRVLAVRRRSDSLFPQVGLDSQGDLMTCECTESDSVALAKQLFTEFSSRKKVREAYCAQHRLDPNDAKSLQKAWPTLKKETAPLFVLFESYTDFCKNMHHAYADLFTTLYGTQKGNQVFFVACFDPDDTAAPVLDPMISKFNPEQFVILTGGQYHRQGLIQLDLKRRQIKAILDKYNEAVVSYQQGLYDVVLPCGKIESSGIDPDDLPVF